MQRLYLGEIWQDLDLVCPDEDGSHLNPDDFSSAWRDNLRRACITRRIRLHDCRDLSNTFLRDCGIPETIRIVATQKSAEFGVAYRHYM